MESLLHPAQVKIAEDLHRFRILVCGRKFGKTTLGSEEISQNAYSGNNRRILYIAPTLEDARRLMWDRLNSKLRNIIKKKNDTRLELKIKTKDGGNSDIFLGSWEKVQDYRGDEFDLIVPDETQDYKEFWTGWHEALRPTLSPRKGMALFMGTPKGFNHFYDLFINESKDPDYKSFRFTSYDNPYLDIEEIAKAKSELTEDRFAQEYLADFRKTEGLVYKEFDRQKHLFDDLSQIKGVRRYFAGVDFGFTNPAVVLPIKEDFDSTLYVLPEWYKTQQTDRMIAEYVSSAGFDIVYPDPESASGIAELKKLKVNVGEVIKNKDSIRNGINKLRDLFKQNKIKIHTSCQNLIWELETYAYPDKKELRNEDENPIKENDHAVDALRYAISAQTDIIKSVAKTYIPTNLSRNPTPQARTETKTFYPHLQ